MEWHVAHTWRAAATEGAGGQSTLSGGGCGSGWCPRQPRSRRSGAAGAAVCVRVQEQRQRRQLAVQRPPACRPGIRGGWSGGRRSCKERRGVAAGPQGFGGAWRACMLHVPETPPPAGARCCCCRLQTAGASNAAACAGPGCSSEPQLYRSCCTRRPRMLHCCCIPPLSWLRCSCSVPPPCCLPASMQCSTPRCLPEAAAACCWRRSAAAGACGMCASLQRACTAAPLAARTTPTQRPT